MTSGLHSKVLAISESMDRIVGTFDKHFNLVYSVMITKLTTRHSGLDVPACGAKPLDH